MKIVAEVLILLLLVGTGKNVVVQEILQQIIPIKMGSLFDPQKIQFEHLSFKHDEGNVLERVSVTNHTSKKDSQNIIKYYKSFRKSNKYPDSNFLEIFEKYSKIMTKATIKYIFSLESGLEGIKMYVLNETNRIFQFAYIVMATIAIIIFKRSVVYILHKINTAFEIFLRPLIKEIESIREDTSKLTVVLQETNEKIDNVLLKSDECLREISQHDSDLLVSNIVNNVRELIEERKECEPKSAPICKNCEVKQSSQIRTDASSQTEDYDLHLSNPNSNHDVSTKRDAIPYKSIREKMSILRNTDSFPKKPTSLHSPGVPRLQRIWIGGKWYLEGLNELREAYSMTNIYRAENFRNDNKLSENTATVNKSCSSVQQTCELRTSTPSCSGILLPFSKFVTREQEINQIYQGKEAEQHSQREIKTSEIRNPINENDNDIPKRSYSMPQRHISGSNIKKKEIEQEPLNIYSPTIPFSTRIIGKSYSDNSINKLARTPTSRITSRAVLENIANQSFQGNLPRSRSGNKIGYDGTVSYPDAWQMKTAHRQELRLGNSNSVYRFRSQELREKVPRAPLRKYSILKRVKSSSENAKRI